MNEAGFLDAKGAAAFLACPVSRIYQLTFRKVIPHYKMGGSIRFKPEELRAFMEAGRVEPVNAAGVR